MAKRKTPALRLPKANFDISRVNKFRAVIAWFLAINNISSVLAIIFYIIWIPVGLFFLWFITANFRVGAFDALMGSPRTQTEQVGETAQPTETTVPGVGRVNVACVQSSLSEDAIIKIVQEKSDQSLTDDEKTKLQSCVVEDASPSPSE